MPPDDSERRRAARRIPQTDEALSRVRLRTGRELAVVNISDHGTLLEGVTRLLPNTRTDIHIVTRNGRVLVRTRVVRALVWRLERDVVWYRTALAFETAVDIDAAPAPSEANGPAPSERSSGHGTDEHESRGYPLPAEIPSDISAPGTLYPNPDGQHRV